MPENQHHRRTWRHVHHGIQPLPSQSVLQGLDLTGYLPGEPPPPQLAICDLHPAPPAAAELPAAAPTAAPDSTPDVPPPLVTYSIQAGFISGEGGCDGGMSSAGSTCARGSPAAAAAAHAAGGSRAAAEAAASTAAAAGRSGGAPLASAGSGAHTFVVPCADTLRLRCRPASELLLSAALRSCSSRAACCPQLAAKCLSSVILQEPLPAILAGCASLTAHHG